MHVKGAAVEEVSFLETVELSRLVLEQTDRHQTHTTRQTYSPKTEGECVCVSTEYLNTSVSFIVSQNMEQVHAVEMPSSTRGLTSDSTAL